MLLKLLPFLLALPNFAFADEAGVRTYHYDRAKEALELFIANADYYLGRRDTPEVQAIRADKTAFCYEQLAHLESNLSAAYLALTNLVAGGSALGNLPELESDEQFKTLYHFELPFGLNDLSSYCLNEKTLVGLGDAKGVRIATIEDVDNAISVTLSTARRLVTKIDAAETAHHFEPGRACSGKVCGAD